MKHATWWIGWMAAIALLVGRMPEAHAATVTWTYTVSNGKASVGGGYSSPAVPQTTRGAIAIPSALAGYPVTGIESFAFYQNTNLTSVTIPNSVTSIGWEAFSGCRGLERVTIGNGVREIGREAFEGCTAIKSVAIPNSVTDIGYAAFYNCTGLKTVTIGNGVREIGAEAFYGCNSLTSIAIPNSVTDIGHDAFHNCTGLKTVTIGNGVREIGSGAFEGCTAIKSVAIPNSVTDIGYDAFYNCTGLKTVTIGNGVREIGAEAFYGCNSLTNIEVSTENANFASGDGILFSKDKTTLVRYPAGKNRTYAVPSYVKRIEDSAFSGCTGLTSVAIPDGVTDIGSCAFGDCTGLTEMTLPASVANLGRATNCVVYSEITGSGCRPGAGGGQSTYWVVGPFDGCTALKTLYVPGPWHGTAMLEGIVPNGCKVVYVVAVSFDAAGGTCTVQTKTWEAGKPFGTLPVPKKTGYVFGGWWTGANGSGTRMTSASPVPGKLKTLHAKWTATSYTVKFNANGGTGSMAAQTIAYGKTAKLRKNAFKRSGFVFAGWAKSKTGKVEYANQAGVKNLRSNGGTVTLYAKWARPAYTVAFNANGGRGKMAAQSMAYGKSAKLRKNAFTRKGYWFLGWAKSKDGKVAYADGAAVRNLRTDGKTTTLHAVWEKARTVKFNANGGTCAVAEKDFKVGREYGAFPTPNRAWHTFLGWYTAADGGEWVSPADIAETAGTRTLFARWAYLPLRLGAESQSVGPLGAGRLSVAVSAKADWTAASDVEWILVHTQSINAGEGALVYDVAANEGNARTGRIVISANGKAFSFTVSQQARTLKLSASKKVFSKKAATGQKLGVTATVSWKAQSSASWLKVKTPAGKGDGTIVYELPENKGSGRAANITVTGGGKSALFRVEQKGKDGSEAVPETPVESHYLQIEPGRQTYDMGEATNETALVMSDLSWTAATTNDWISLSTTNGSGYGVVAYQVAANAGNARTGTIAVAGGSLQATLTIEQKGPADEPPYLALLPEKRTATAAAAPDETVWVEANVAWTVGVSDEWIDLKTTTGRGNGRLAYSMYANSSANSRTGTITVVGGGLAGTFTLTQAGTGTGSGSGSSGSGTAVAPAAKKLVVYPIARPHGNAAATDAFQVEANVKWTAIPSTNWITLATKSGNGDGTVKYGIAENTGGQRTGTITLKGGGLTAVFTITQSGVGTQGGIATRPHASAPVAKTLKVDPPTMKLGTWKAQKGLICRVAQTPRPDFEWKAVAPTSPWIHLKTTTGTGPGPIVFDVDENPDTKAERLGFIYVRGSGYPQARCKVVQPPKVPVLEVSPRSIPDVSWKGAVKSLQVTANVDWIASANVDWIRLEPSKGLKDGTITVTVEQNPKGSQRQGVITVSGGGLVRKIPVTQEKATILLVSPTSKSHSFKADWGELGVRANVRWSASTPNGWIVLKKTGGKGSSNAHEREPIRYDVKANNSTNARTGTITVSGGGKTVKVTVKQAAKPFLTVTPTAGTVPFDAGSYKLTVKANVDWSVTRDKSWITPDPVKGKGSRTIVFSVSKNTTGANRPATLTVRGGGIKREITIVQKKEPVLKLEPNKKTYMYDSFYSWFYVTADADWTAEVVKGKEWVTLRTASGKGNGKKNGGFVDFDVTENTTGSSRAAQITVSGGGKTATFTLTQKAPLPNLCFYKPDGWPAAVFVTTHETYTTQQTTFQASSQWTVPCIRYAWANLGAGKAGAHTVKRALTGPASSTVTMPHNGLSTNTYTTAHFYYGLSVGNAVVSAPNSPGRYTVTITLDSGNAVQESNENDNMTNVTFTVVSSYAYSTRDASKKKSGGRAAESDATGDASWVVVTASGGENAEAVADGDEGTAWTADASNGAWVVLSFAEALDVDDVEVVGENLPEGMRVLLSEDAEEWREEVPGRARYVWVAFPASEEPPAVREIRVIEEEFPARE